MLGAEQVQDNMPGCMDVLWAIEQTGLYVQALEQEEADDEEPSSKKDKKDKKEDKKDKKSSKKDKEPEKKKVKKSAEGAVVHEFRKEPRPPAVYY